VEVERRQHDDLRRAAALPQLTGCGDPVRSRHTNRSSAAGVVSSRRWTGRYRPGRQARRYLIAAATGPVDIPEPSAMITVKLPASLAARVRRHATSVV
jgi:hypothetical protein